MFTECVKHLSSKNQWVHYKHLLIIQQPTSIRQLLLEITIQLQKRQKSMKLRWAHRSCYFIIGSMCACSNFAVCKWNIWPKCVVFMNARKLFASETSLQSDGSPYLEAKVGHNAGDSTFQTRYLVNHFQRLCSDEQNPIQTIIKLIRFA